MSWNDGSDPVRPTVLCVDDDPNVCRALARTLRSHGAEVFMAHHGTHGYHIAATMSPDLIITDLRMPQGEGCYLIECLKRDKSTSHIPIVVFSGVRDPEIESKVHDLGAVKFLSKPTMVDTLIEELRSYIDLS